MELAYELDISLFARVIPIALEISPRINVGIMTSKNPPSKVLAMET